MEAKRRNRYEVGSLEKYINTTRYKVVLEGTRLPVGT